MMPNTYGPHIFQRHGIDPACARCKHAEGEAPHPPGAVVSRVGALIASALGLEAEVLGIIREVNSGGLRGPDVLVFVRELPQEHHTAARFEIVITRKVGRKEFYRAIRVAEDAGPWFLARGIHEMYSQLAEAEE